MLTSTTGEEEKTFHRSILASVRTPVHTAVVRCVRMEAADHFDSRECKRKPRGACRPAHNSTACAHRRLRTAAPDVTLANFEEGVRLRSFLKNDPEILPIVMCLHDIVLSYLVVPLRNGDQVAAQDDAHVWYVATVTRAGTGALLLHYNGWADRYNQVLSFPSPRIRELQGAQRFADMSDEYPRKSGRCAPVPVAPQYHLGPSAVFDPALKVQCYFS
jgi:hypothetical protein